MAVRLGRFEFPQGQENPPDACARYDAIIGAPSGFTRHYLSMQDNWSGSFTKWSLENDRIPIIAVHAWTNNRTPIKWSAVTAGTYDSAIKLHANDLLKLMVDVNTHVPVYLNFHHEPENEENGQISGDINGTCGLRADYKKAAARFNSLVVGVLGKRVRTGTTLMKGSYENGEWNQWIPTTSRWFGVDGYSHGSVKETFDSIYTSAHDAATLAGKSLLIQEMGCAEVSGTDFKAQFFRDARATFKTWPELRGVCYSNVSAKEDYRVDTSPAALAAFQAWAQDNYFQGTWT